MGKEGIDVPKASLNVAQPPGAESFGIANITCTTATCSCVYVSLCRAARGLGKPRRQFPPYPRSLAARMLALGFIDSRQLYSTNADDRN